VNKVNVQHRVAPRPKQCAICKQPVTKADFAGKKATYTHVPGRKKLGLRWQHLACKSLRVRRKGRGAGGRRSSRG